MDRRSSPARCAVGDVDPQVAGDPLDAVLQHRLVDQRPQVLAGVAAQAAAGPVVVGAAGVGVGAGGDRGDVDPLDVRAAGHHALQPPVGQLDEGDLGELARLDGAAPPVSRCSAPTRLSPRSRSSTSSTRQLGECRRHGDTYTYGRSMIRKCTGCHRQQQADWIFGGTPESCLPDHHLSADFRGVFPNMRLPYRSETSCRTTTKDSGSAGAS